MKKKLEEKDITLEMVKGSDFGCCNCLWYEIECVKAAKFLPAISVAGKPSCKAYTYCD